jgi:hypothetical protein
MRNSKLKVEKKPCILAMSIQQMTGNSYPIVQKRSNITQISSYPANFAGGIAEFGSWAAYPEEGEETITLQIEQNSRPS